MTEGESLRFSGLSYADFTPQKAKETAAKISPAMRRPLAERVRQALQFHHDEGHAEAARFCILVLNALRNAKAVATAGDT